MFGDSTFSDDSTGEEGFSLSLFLAVSLFVDGSDISGASFGVESEPAFPTTGVLMGVDTSSEAPSDRSMSSEGQLITFGLNWISHKA